MEKYRQKLGERNGQKYTRHEDVKEGRKKIRKKYPHSIKGNGDM